MSRIGKLIFNADEDHCSFALNGVNFSGKLFHKPPALDYYSKSLLQLPYSCDGINIHCVTSSFLLSIELLAHKSRTETIIGTVTRVLTCMEMYPI